MIDFNLSDPPAYRFGLFGHRASGKSVYLVALGASRREETDGVSATYLNALSPEAGVNLATLRSREEIGLAYAESLKALEERRLPPQTDSADGNLRYAFELGRPGDAIAPFIGATIRTIEISDHAGELVNRLTTEIKKAGQLRSFLARRDGLILVAEAPRPDDDAATRSKSLAEVTALGSRLSEVLENQSLEAIRCRTLVLLVTKWDRIHSFDGIQREGETETAFLQRLREEESRHDKLFEAWLETPQASEHRRLLQELRVRFGENAVRAYPVTAFGQAHVEVDPHNKDKLIELPTTLPLPTLNLVKPLTFLAERTDAVIREALVAATEQYDPGRKFHVWRLIDRVHFRRSFLPIFNDVRPRFGDDEELREALDAALVRRNSAHRSQSRIGLTGAIIASVMTMLILDANAAMQQRRIAEGALSRPSVFALIDADERLALRHASSFWPRGSYQRWLLPETEVLVLRESLQVAECAEWQNTLNVANGTADRQTVDDFQRRVAVAPRCADLRTTISRYVVDQRNQAILDSIDSELNQFEFVRAIELIYSAARNPDTPRESLPELRSRLASMNNRINEQAGKVESRESGGQQVLEIRREILLALGNPPGDLIETEGVLRGQLDAEQQPLELRIACIDYAALLREATDLSALSGARQSWPRLERIDSLSGKIGAWPHGSRSEFKSAAQQLRSHVDSLRRLRIERVRTSGELVEALRVTDASWKVTIADELLDAKINTKRSDGRLNHLFTFQAFTVGLDVRPIVRAALTENGFFSDYSWASYFAGSSPLTWDAFGAQGWSMDLLLIGAKNGQVPGALKVTIIPGMPPLPPAGANAPAACNR